MKRLNAYIVSLSLAVLAACVVLIVAKRSATAAAMDQLVSLQAARKSQEAKRSRIGRLEQRVLRLQEEILLLEASVEEANRSRKLREDSGEDAWDGVEAWMDRTNRLGQFLERNRQYRIAEMDLLTPHDWLAVTKSGQLRTEADYRVALSFLRRDAKAKASAPIREAWKAFEAKSEGRPLEDFRELAEYGNGKLSLGMLSRYRLMTEADEELGPRIIGGGSQETFIEKAFVDDLWEFNVKVMSRAFVSGGSWNFRSKEYLVAALERFVSENGREPEESDELIPYVEDEDHREALPAMFEALTTVPELGE